MLSFGFHRSPLLCALWDSAFFSVFGTCCYLWPLACFCTHLMFNISFCCCRHNVSNIFVQLTEGRSARDQPKQPPAKKNLVPALRPSIRTPFGSSCPSGSNTHSEFSSGLVAVDLIHLFLARCLLLAGNCLPYHQPEFLQIKIPGKHWGFLALFVWHLDSTYFVENSLGYQRSGFSGWNFLRLLSKVFPGSRKAPWLTGYGTSGSFLLALGFYLPLLKIP